MLEFNLSYQRKRLELKQNFSIAHGTYTHRDCLLLEIEFDGVVGLGECTAINYLGWDIDVLENKVQELIDTRISVEEDDRGFYFIKGNIALSPIACAIDECLLDIYLKRKELSSIESLISIGKKQNQCQSSFTITADDTQTFIENMYQCNWSYLKLKLGRSFDLELLEELQNHSFKHIRIDANTAWDSNRIAVYAKLCSSLDIDFIEQPFDLKSSETNKQLFNETNVPIIADEAFHGWQDLEMCAQYFNGVNIKLQKCGGPRNAINILEKLDRLGLKSMIGCMTESSVGISAAAQFVSYVDFIDLDGSHLISNDFAVGVDIVDGKVFSNENYGLGGSLK